MSKRGRRTTASRVDAAFFRKANVWSGAMNEAVARCDAFARMDGKWRIWAVLIAAYVFALGPAARVGRFSHADERHYTDAALWMISSGDYWTPRYADGSPRLRKPPGVYWCVAVAFKLFGPSPVSAHVASMLAGAGVLLATYLLARESGAVPSAAFTAVAVLITHPHFLQYANIVNPDIFQTLGLTVGFVGLARLLRRGRLDAAAILAILLGAAWAALAKGLLAFVFLIFCAVALMDSRCAGLDICRRLAIGLVISAILIVGAVLLLLTHRHGRLLADDFIRDQIFGQLLKTEPHRKILHLFGYLLYLPLSLHFWFWPLFRNLRRFPNLAPFRSHLRLFLGWTLICAIIFSLASNVKPRYLLSTAPLLSVAVALALDAGGSAPVPRALIRGLWTIAWAGVLMLSLAIEPDWQFALWPLVALGGLFALGRFSPRLISNGPLAARIAAMCVLIAWAPLQGFAMHKLWTFDAAHRVADLFREARRLHPEIRLMLTDYDQAELARGRLLLGEPFPTISLHDYLWLGRSDPVDARLRPSERYFSAGGAESEFDVAFETPLPLTRLAPADRRGNEWLSFLYLLREGYPLRTYAVELRRPTALNADH